MLRQRHHDRQSGGVVEGAVEIGVLVRHDDDVLVGCAGQRAPDARTLQARDPFHLRPHPKLDRLAGSNQFSQREAILVSEREAGQCNAATHGPPRRHVAGIAVDEDDGGRAIVLCAL